MDDYRTKVFKLLPNLKYLDDTDADDNDEEESDEGEDGDVNGAEEEDDAEGENVFTREEAVPALIVVGAGIEKKRQPRNFEGCDLTEKIRESVTVNFD